MVIIKHGTAYEELNSYSCICPKCDCEFEYVERDVNEYLNEECYVICPECFSDIKLPEQAESEEDEIISNNLCSSCTNMGCEFQSGIVRTECAFYMPPHIEPDNCGNYVVMQPVKPQEPSITWVTGADGAKIAFWNVPVWKVTKICEILGEPQESEE